ncbi:stage III sporulation protein AA [Paenibacillus sp. HJGM_3]|uniref:stage III sporulation protein AA n=1 Tax=Paenibacillus sp. HJGM_3 TaxID=3379816 RepID=UPI00385AE2D7
MNPILPFLPPSLRRLIEQVPAEIRDRMEELRIREGRPLELSGTGSAGFVTARGEWTADAGRGYRPNRDECLQLLDLLTDHSVYTFEEELKRGYITVQGGHRVGLAGRTVLEHGQVKLIRDIAGFNIRIARERPGAALPLLPHLWDEASGRPHHTLFLSPPQQGKTTMIRDLARLLSWGGSLPAPAGSAGLKVGIVDERSEIAACVKGVPTFDVGPRTDVLDRCPKAEGMMMLIRSMSPDVLVVDEIGRQADADAIEEALHAGIVVLATAHARDADDAARRPALRQLLAAGRFARLVALRRSPGGVHADVADAAGRVLARLPAPARAAPAGDSGDAPATARRPAARPLAAAPRAPAPAALSRAAVHAAPAAPAAAAAPPGEERPPC